MPLQEILHQDHACFTTLPEDAVLDQAATALGRYGKTAVVVLESGRIKGILTRTDMVGALEPGGHAPSGERTIAHLMTRDVVTADPRSSFDHALDRMAQSRIEHLPVVENGQLLTVIHEHDLLRCRIRMLQKDIDQLREYIENLHNAKQD